MNDDDRKELDRRNAAIDAPADGPPTHVALGYRCPLCEGSGTLTVLGPNHYSARGELVTCGRCCGVGACGRMVPIEELWNALRAQRFDEDNDDGRETH